MICKRASVNEYWVPVSTGMILLDVQCLISEAQFLNCRRYEIQSLNSWTPELKSAKKIGQEKPILKKSEFCLLIVRKISPIGDWEVRNGIQEEIMAREVG